MVAGGTPPEPGTPKPHFGPYVPAEGGLLEATIVVKAAPEMTKSHGVTVCTAAVLDDGRFIRLYPVKWSEYHQGQAKRYCRVRVHAVPSDEAAKRPESHKLRTNLTVVDTTLCSGKPTPWDARMAILRQNLEPDGVASLKARQMEWRTSIGFVKVRELVDFHIDGSPEEIIQEADYRESAQRTLTGTAAGMEGRRIDSIKHVFRYDWRCSGSCCDTGEPHKMQCEDWEIFESFRRWRKDPRYEEKQALDKALWNKYYDEMARKDLHFILGTTSDPAHQQAFTIIGIVYPPTDDADNRPFAPKLGAGHAFRLPSGPKKARRKPVQKGQARLSD